MNGIEPNGTERTNGNGASELATEGARQRERRAGTGRESLLSSSGVVGSRESCEEEEEEEIKPGCCVWN